MLLAIELSEILPLILPFAFIEFAFKVYCVIDILREDRKVKVSKPFWIVVVIFVSLSWVLYLLVGKED